MDKLFLELGEPVKACSFLSPSPMTPKKMEKFKATRLFFKIIKFKKSGFIK